VSLETVEFGVTPFDLNCSFTQSPSKKEITEKVVETIDSPKWAT
jgi:hypothetical protein